MRRLVTIAFVLLALTPAAAHKATPTAEQPNGWFYSQHCCTRTDCHRALPGQVTEVSGGYAVYKAIPKNWEDLTKPPPGWEIVVGRAPEFVPYNDKRVLQSGDAQLHVCEVPAAEKVRCLYYPGMF